MSEHRRNAVPGQSLRTEINAVGLPLPGVSENEARRWWWWGGVLGEAAVAAETNGRINMQVRFPPGAPESSVWEETQTPPEKTLCNGGGGGGPLLA